MLSLVGLAVVVVMVFGGYTLAGGNIAIIVAALPYELMIIGGAAIGAFLIGNSAGVIRASIAGLAKMVKGPKWAGGDYRDLLCLLYLLVRVARTRGMVGLEPHIEHPAESEIFSRYPRIAGDPFAIGLIADTLRMIAMNLEDPHQVEEHLERQIEKHHQEALRPADALQTMADALPALGIVAAVLGVIKTMASVSEPPEILGRMIASALVGTFLGVFLAYGAVGPIAQRLREITDEETRFYTVIRDILAAHLKGNAPHVSVEIGRGNVPSRFQPSFVELERAVNALAPA